MSSKHHFLRVIAVVSVASLLFGGAFLLRGRHRATEPSSSVPITGVRSPSAPVSLPPHLQPQLTSSPILLRGEPEQRDDGNGPRPRSRLTEMRDRVMAANPDLAQFRFLQRKVLLKREERELLREIYQDPELLKAAKRDLLAEGEKSFSEDRQFQRLYRVEYLGMSLDWNDNPSRQSFLNVIKELIVAKNISDAQELELRRSLAGDKVELFMILLHYDRAQAEALLTDAQGTDLMKLLEYARSRYDGLQKLARKG